MTACGFKGTVFPASVKNVKMFNVKMFSVWEMSFATIPYFIASKLNAVLHQHSLIVCEGESEQINTKGPLVIISL
jgi:hypothetical protein